MTHTGEKKEHLILSAMESTI